MQKYSKAIAAAIALIVSIAGVYSINLEFLATEEMKLGIISLVTVLGTIFAPKNT